jgi:hypothetical protein
MQLGRSRSGPWRLGWLVVVLVLSSSACFHYRLTPVGADGRTLAPATEPQAETLWSFVWGVVQPTLRPSTCQGNGVAEVTTSSNFGFALLTVVTLGLVAPVEVEWRCAKDSPAQGDDF